MIEAGRWAGRAAARPVDIHGGFRCDPGVHGREEVRRLGVGGGQPIDEPSPSPSALHRPTLLPAG